MTLILLSLMLLFFILTLISFFYWKNYFKQKKRNNELSELILNSQHRCGWIRVYGGVGGVYKITLSPYLQGLLKINRELSLTEFFELFSWKNHSLYTIKDQVASLVKGGDGLFFTENLKTNKKLYLKCELVSFCFFKSREIVIVGSLTDVSEEIEVQNKLHYERERNSHISKLAALGDITALIVHEINSPLTIFLTQLKKLSQIKVEEKDEKNFNLIRDKLQKGVDKIGSIMRSVDRLDLTKDKDNKVSTQVLNIINEVQMRVGEVLKREGIQLQVTNVSDQLRVDLKSVHFTEALMVLIANSIEVLKDVPISSPRWIKINAIENESELKLQVLDSGPGISPEEQEKLFSSFYTTKRNSKNSGLGLTIAKTIVEYNEGSLIFNPDHANTCFEIYFPKAKPNTNNNTSTSSALASV